MRVSPGIEQGTRPSVAIVTDSAACIPRGLQERYGIAVVPLVFLVDDKPYSDDESWSEEQFYGMLAASAKLPTTTASPPADFLEAFRQASRRSGQVLCITIGSNLSGNYASACSAANLARQQMGDTEIRVMDSRNAAMAEGFAVLAAAQAAGVGGDLEEAAGRAAAVIARTYLLGVLDNLYYVARSGRVPMALAWASSLLQIKPIFQYHNGDVGLVERVRTKPRAIERLLHLMAQRLQPGEPLHVAVVHAHAALDAQRLVQQVQERFQPAELLLTPFSRVMATHSGPGLLGLAFYSG